MTIENIRQELSHAAPVLTFTDAARERVQGFLAAQNKPGLALRVAITGRTSGGFRYAMGLVEETSRDAGDLMLDAGAFSVLIDPESLGDLRGARIDFVESAGGGGLQIDNPNPVWREPLALRVQEVIESRINPGVASHGGWVELLGVKGSKAYIRMGGGCQGCGMADVTLKQGIETIIFSDVPEITAVVDETDHASGDNPYYKPAKGAA
ncbi:MAG: NifU family protein [Dehalococcoidia bacterium]